MAKKDERKIHLDPTEWRDAMKNVEPAKPDKTDKPKKVPKVAPRGKGR
jgi:hypothetical protein